MKKREEATTIEEFLRLVAEHVAKGSVFGDCSGNGSRYVLSSLTPLRIMQVWAVDRSLSINCTQEWVADDTMLARMVLAGVQFNDCSMDKFPELGDKPDQEAVERAIARCRAAYNR